MRFTSSQPTNHNLLLYIFQLIAPSQAPIVADIPLPPLELKQKLENRSEKTRKDKRREWNIAVISTKNENKKRT
jgi:hypothetical protein